MHFPYSLFEITKISKEHMKSSKISKNIKKDTIFTYNSFADILYYTI